MYMSMSISVGNSFGIQPRYEWFLNKNKVIELYSKKKKKCFGRQKQNSKSEVNVSIHAIS